MTDGRINSNTNGRDERFLSLIEKSIDHFGLELDNLTIFTESASGYYMCTVIAAALAGATRVFALGHSSGYGNAKVVNERISWLSKKMGVDKRITFVTKKNCAEISKSDIITN